MFLVFFTFVKLSTENYTLVEKKSIFNDTELKKRG